MTSKLIIFSLFVLVALTGGKCAVVATSGGGSSGSDRDKGSGTVIITTTRQLAGQFIDAPVEGLRYVSGSVSGVTGVRGEFQYEPDNTIQFFIGDIALGEAVGGQAMITPLDLVQDGTLDTPAVINIARLLQSLDSVPEDGAITLPPELRTAATLSNEALSAAIQFLDFTDETAFVNAATQLIAVLTAPYPFTAILIDADSARRHLRESLAESGIVN